jgi:hypothetical protein
LSRSYLADELLNIYLAKLNEDPSDSKKLRELLSNQTYIQQYYNYLDDLFDRNSFEGEKWNTFAREVLFFNKESLQYIVNRIMHLYRKYGKSENGSYIEIRPHNKDNILFQRLLQLNKLFEFSKDLLDEIVPKLMRTIHFEISNSDLNSNYIAGKIDWQKTLCLVNKNSLESPLQFRIKKLHRDFLTPENIVMIVSLHSLIRDANMVINYDFPDSLTEIETSILNEIMEKCRWLLKRPIISDLVPLVNKYLELDLHDTQILSIELKFKDRVIEKKIGIYYKQLYQWFLRYKYTDIKNISPTSNNFLISSRKDLDTMFELYILLEIVEFFCSNNNANFSLLVPNMTKNRRFEFGYNISNEEVNFNLFYEMNYEKNINGWLLNSKPDFSIETHDRLIMVMDAKNWSNRSKDEARYKMLGYLNNLDLTTCIVFFPSDKGFRPLISFTPKISVENHLDQSITECCFPISMNNIRDEKINILGSLHQIIVETVKKYQ